MTYPDPKSSAPSIRLNKFLASAGVASRRAADELILSGRVRVDGRVVTTLGTKIDPEKQRVFVDGNEVVILDEPIYILFNKPKDCITTASDERGRTTVMDYVSLKKRVFPVGRLDRHTTGVLLLTNDGTFANILMHPSREVEKAYVVTLDKALTREDAGRIESGLKLSDGMTAPASLSAIPGGKNKSVGITIHEGRNRQIHRMFETLGYSVEKLDRVAYAGITYEGLSRGRWRYMTSSEVRRAKAAAGEQMPSGK